MTKTFQVKAREWLNGYIEENRHRSIDYGTCMDFSRHLDQEAQEKPQQPEEIEQLSADSYIYQPDSGKIVIVHKLNQVIEALNRLTHKD